jgi:two-component system cell cycle response regulator DivK
LNDVLELQGYRVVGTGLGAAAVQLAREHQPDLIILDMRLPDMSGLEAVRQLKANELTRMIPIIAVTAFAMREDERKILDGGCDLYIPKPFIPSEFLGTVARFLDQRAVMNVKCGEATGLN